MADVVTISVSMPAEMQRLIMEQIQARFFGNISEYFRYLVREDLKQAGGPLARPSPALASTALSLHNASPSVLRQASDDDLLAFANFLASADPASPRRWMRMHLGDLVREELDQRQLPIPAKLPGTQDPAPSFRQAIHSDPEEILLKKFYKAPTANDPAKPYVFDEEELRKFAALCYVEELERIRDKWRPGSTAWKGADALIRLRKGEGTSEQRKEWFGLITEQVLLEIRVEIALLRRGWGPADGMGPAPVPLPKPPKPKPGSARAKPPKIED